MAHMHHTDCAVGLQQQTNARIIFSHEYHLQFSLVYLHVVLYPRTNQYQTPRQICLEFRQELAIVLAFMVI